MNKTKNSVNMLKKEKKMFYILKLRIKIKEMKFNKLNLNLKLIEKI
jgi:hypothetical protein